ncbi:MAG TPA: hypothetical protein VNO51_12195 [Ilumatobacteraceae bacterium]|nr:hypothetical protein [Ilumatobacteraceae bacterium]
MAGDVVDVVVFGGVVIDSATSVVVAAGTAAASDGVALLAARLVQPVVARISPVIQIVDRRAMT